MINEKNNKAIVGLCKIKSPFYYYIQYTDGTNINEFINEIYKTFAKKCGSFKQFGNRMYFAPFWSKNEFYYIPNNSYFIGNENGILQEFLITETEFKENYEIY